MISRASADLRFAMPEVPRDAVHDAAGPSVSKAPIGAKSPITETLVAQDESAVAAAVRQAFERRHAIYPQGGGTSLDYGLPRRKPGVALSLAALNRVLEHAADDMTITVEAGITLAELNRHLAVKGQWLPIDAPDPDRASIGGIIASNAFGPRRHGHGTIGDYLIGFRAIDGRGEAYCGGGKVVKNAAGYNLPRLMVGSRGTLGLITQATFMVRPVPACSAALHSATCRALARPNACWPAWAKAWLRRRSWSCWLARRGRTVHCPRCRNRPSRGWRSVSKAVRSRFRRCSRLCATNGNRPARTV